MVTGKTKKGFIASFNPSQFADVSKKDFQKKYSPRLRDWESVWEEISKLKPKRKKKEVKEE